MKKIACWMIVPAFLSVCSSPSNSISAPNQKSLTEAKRAASNTGKALYASYDFGLTWAPAGGDLPDGASIEVMEKMGEQMVLATSNYGLFIGHPEKPVWKRVGQDLPNQKITALHIAGPVMYAGVYEAGIFVSKDEGATWTSLNKGLLDLSVRSILKINGTLLVGTNTGMFRLEQGQTRWQKIFSEGQVTSLKTAAGKIVGGTNLGGIFSEDGGNNWRWIIKKGALHNISILSDKIIAMEISGDLRISADWGKTWELVNYFPRQYSYIYEAAEAAGYFVFSNNYGVHHSEDGGKTWALVFPNEETVFYDFQVFGQTIYAGTRGWNERRGKSGF